MSAESHIRLELGERYAQLVFHRPEARNALSSSVMEEMEAAIGAVEAWVREGTRHVALLLSSSDPRIFVAGADLKELRNLHGYEGGRAFAERGRRLLDRLEDLPIPVVAAMEGPALGGGAELALACDLRVMSESSYFSFVQLRVGIVPGWGGGRRLAEIVGWKRALGLFVTTARLPAAEALNLGLADRLVPDGQAIHEALKLVEEMAMLPPLAVRALKPLLRRLSATSPSEGEGFEAEAFGRLWATADHEEAIASLMDRQPGEFHGE